MWLASQKTVLSGSVEPVPHGQGRAVDVLHNCFFLTLHCYILDYFSHDFVVTHHTGTIRATIFRSSPYGLHYGERKELSVLHFLPLIPFPVLLLKPDWSAVVSWWLEYIYIIYICTPTIHIYRSGGARVGHPIHNSCLCLFFLERDCIYLDADCLDDHIKRKTFQTCTLISPPRQARVKRVRKRYCAHSARSSNTRTKVLVFWLFVLPTQIVLPHIKKKIVSTSR